MIAELERELTWLRNREKCERNRPSRVQDLRLIQHLAELQQRLMIWQAWNR